MTVEVRPDQGSGDAALVARVGARIGGAEGVDGSLLAGNAVADGLQFGELVLTDDAANVRTRERVVRAGNFGFECAADVTTYEGTYGYCLVRRAAGSTLVDISK